MGFFSPAYWVIQNPVTVVIIQIQVKVIYKKNSSMQAKLDL